MNVSAEQVKSDFDRIAALETAESGDRDYDDFLLSLVPESARDILDVGCGTGTLTIQLSSAMRRVTGIDFSSAMIDKARRFEDPPRLRFDCADFLGCSLPTESFDCIVSAATLHHLPAREAISKMKQLLRPQGVLILHDLRRNTTFSENAIAVMPYIRQRLMKIKFRGWAKRKEVRRAWKEHGANDHYLSRSEIEHLISSELPNAAVHQHPLWRYTAVWQKLKSPTSL